MLDGMNGGGELPPGWAWGRIDEICNVNPATDTSELPPDVDVAFVPMAAVAELSGRVNAEIRRPLTEVSKGFTRFRPGDVIFAKITPCMENGKIAVVPDLPLNIGFGSTEFHVLRPASGVPPRYIFHYLTQQRFRHTAKRSMTGAVGQQRVPTEYLKGAVIPIAPAAEQRRIVAKIDELFGEIEAGEQELEKAREGLEAYRRAVLKAAVTGELTREWREKNAPNETGADLLNRILAERRAAWEWAELPKFMAKSRRPRRVAAKGQYTEPNPLNVSDLPKLPPGWTWASVEQLGSISGGLTQNSKRNNLARHVPFLRVANVREARLDLEDLREIGIEDAELGRVLLETGDLLFVEGNGSPDQIGRVAVWDGSVDPCAHQNHLIKARFSELGMGRWVLNWFMSPHGRQAIRAAASSTSGLHTLSISKIAALAVPVPPMRERELILQLVEDALVGVLEASEQNSSQTDETIRLRQSILAAAFSGKLVPQDPADEPASALLERLRAQKATTPTLRRGSRPTRSTRPGHAPSVTEETAP
jgi:type I restriction enzyme S subunit